jgi:predicted glycoside hydrolase/deacetylase ChbG (UPF0249 family)
MTDRFLIVNADDFGRSPGTNAGVIRAYEHGVVTSTSLMVRWPAARTAAAYARDHAELSVGLHLDLGEWSFRAGQWTRMYGEADPEQEVAAQLARFHELMGRDPTHLDSHQHVHREEPVLSLMQTRAAQLGVPLREQQPIVYSGAFYGQSGRGHPYPEGITTGALVALIKALPRGITELGCHPGLDARLASSYRDERLREVETLSDLRVQDALTVAGVELCSFFTVPR